MAGELNVKDHAKIEVSDDDDLLDSLIVAAREELESDTWRAFINQTYELKLDRFPDGPIYLPRPPLSSVTSLAYIDTDGNTQTSNDVAGDYRLWSWTEPAVIEPKENEDWPDTTTEEKGAVTVTYVAGYGAAASDVPEGIKHCLRLLVTHMYRMREMYIVDQGIVGIEIPHGLQRFLRKYQFRNERVLEMINGTYR